MSIEEAQYATSPNVGELKVGDHVDGEYGPAVILRIEVSKWRFSEKPKHTLTFLDCESTQEYARGYFPWSPIKDNLAYEAVFTPPNTSPVALAPRALYHPPSSSSGQQEWAK